MTMSTTHAAETASTLPESAPTAFDGFLARARQQRDLEQSTPDCRPESWADPDPSAITRLADTKHPVRHALDRRVGLRNSRRMYYLNLRRICERLQGLPPQTLAETQVMEYPWHLVDAEVAADYARSINARYSNRGTRNEAIGGLRQIITACRRAGLISGARRDEVLEELPIVSPGPSTKRRRLTHAEISALIQACLDDGRRTAIRDAAVIALFATTGMRSCELVSIDMKDWNRTERTILLRSTKNGRDHTVFVHPVAETYLQSWAALRGDGPGALFSWPHIRGGQPVATCSVRDWVNRRRVQAGVAPFGTHDFRRTVATTLLRSHDLSLVSRLLNHSKPASTLIYDLASDDEQRAAITGLGLLAPPASSEIDPQNEQANETAATKESAQ